MNKSHPEYVLIKSSAIGMLLGLLGLPFEHPFDSLKTNMQATNESAKKTIKSIYTRKGFRGFYNGFGINLMRILFKQAYRWPLNITLLSFYTSKL
jgi:hypothetical protein